MLTAAYHMIQRDEDFHDLGPSYNPNLTPSRLQPEPPQPVTGTATQHEVSEETEIWLVMEPFQLTPGGQIPGAENSTLVRTAAEVSRHLGYEPSLSRSGSSNMNVAVAGGTLAIGLGGSRGGERGRPGEWADIDGMMRTAKHVFLLAAAVGGAKRRIGDSSATTRPGLLEQFECESSAKGLLYDLAP